MIEVYCDKTRGRLGNDACVHGSQCELDRFTQFFEKISMSHPLFNWLHPLINRLRPFLRKTFKHLLFKGP